MSRFMVDGQEITAQDLEKMGEAELLDLKAKNQEKLATIREDLRLAGVEFHETGRRSDRDWYSRATFAKIRSGSLDQAIGYELSKRRKRQKTEHAENQRSFYEAFMKAAKRRLSEDLYHELLDEARALSGQTFNR
jgi:hypothetical protein